MTSNALALYKDGSIDLVAVWLVVWRYKYAAIVVATVVVGLTVWLALTMTPIYRAEVVVIPRDGGAGDVNSLASRLGGLASLAGIDLGASGGDRVDALAVLRSRYLVEQFIDRNGLESELLAGDSSSQSLWFAVDRFRRTVVSIVTDVESGTTTIGINWRDPEVAAKWATEFVALANDMIRTRALEESSRNIDYLNKQLQETSVVELQRVLYNLIEAETQRVMLANARVEYAFSVIDPAVPPESRISPRRTLMVLSGTALGALLGAFVALAIHAVAGHRSQNAARAVHSQ